MTVARSVADVLAEQVVFEVECIDRLCCNVYVPGLQYAPGLVAYVHRQLELPIASTAPLARIAEAVDKAVHRFARDNAIPWVNFARGPTQRRHRPRAPWRGWPPAPHCGATRNSSATSTRIGAHCAPSRGRASTSARTLCCARRPGCSVSSGTTRTGTPPPNYAGTSPLTIASGRKRAVLARRVHNKRLYDARSMGALRAEPKSRCPRLLRPAPRQR